MKSASYKFVFGHTIYNYMQPFVYKIFSLSREDFLLNCNK